MIEKKIFQYHKDEYSIPVDIKMNMNKILTFYRDYTYTLFTDVTMEEYVKTNCDSETSSLFFSLSKSSLERYYFFRYIVLNKEGGVFPDISAAINKHLKLFVHDVDDFVIGYDLSNNVFHNHVIISDDEHPILEEILKRVKYNIKNKLYINDIDRRMGKILLTDVIKYYYKKGMGVEMDDTLFKEKMDERIYFEEEDIDYNFKIMGQDYNTFITSQYSYSIASTVNFRT